MAARGFVNILDNPNRQIFDPHFDLTEDQSRDLVEWLRVNTEIDLKSPFYLMLFLRFADG